MEATDPLRHARAELAHAVKTIGAMRQATSIEDFESEWGAYLNCLEKVWNKTERACRASASTFQPWQGQFHRLRKKDMLLRYLKQARDADNHSIQDITEIDPGGTGYRFVNPSGGFIKQMRIENGVLKHYEGDPMIVETRPPQPVAVRVKNNGEWFNPPTTHLDNPVESSHPVHLAELGLAFYQGFVDQAASKFFRNAV